MKAEIGFTVVILQLIRRKKPGYCIEKNSKFQVGFRGRVRGAVID